LLWVGRSIRSIVVVSKLRSFGVLRTPQDDRLWVVEFEEGAVEVL
jgi:hypothetical protein